ncbi:unnamed protein product, partial [marine sediment metagenome]
MKKPTKAMPYSDLIKEHRRLIRIMKFGSPYERSQLIQEQEAELKEYEKEGRIQA